MEKAVRLTVRDVEYYLFCPMAFYLRYAAGIERPMGFWADLGREVEDDVLKSIPGLRIVGRQVALVSERLRLSGRVDAVVETPHGYAPLEVKYSSRLRPWWRYVITLYAILLEEAIGRPVKLGYIYLTEARKRRLVEIKIAEEDRWYAEYAVRACLKLLEGMFRPKPRRARACKNCDYRDLCGY